MEEDAAPRCDLRRGTSGSAMKEIPLSDEYSERSLGSGRGRRGGFGKKAAKTLCKDGESRDGDRTEMPRSKLRAKVRAKGDLKVPS